MGRGEVYAAGEVVRPAVNEGKKKVRINSSVPEFFQDFRALVSPANFLSSVRKARGRVVEIGFVWVVLRSETSVKSVRIEMSRVRRANWELLGLRSQICEEGNRNRAVRKEQTGWREMTILCLFLFTLSRIARVVEPAFPLPQKATIWQAEALTRGR